MNNNEYNAYTIHATRKNRTDITLSITSYVSAAILYFYSVFVNGVSYTSVMQFVSLLFIVVGIYVNQRYTWTNFIYAIKPVENKNSGEIIGYSFFVYRVQGKKSTCLVEIPCRDCIGIIAHKRGEKNEKSTVDTDVARYKFTQTLMPDTYHTAIFRADGGIAHISFEPDEALAAILSSYITKKDIGSADSED